MASPELSRPDLEKRLWDEVDENRFGMLGVVGGQPKHLQPMTMFADKNAGKIWFYTNKDKIDEYWSSHVSAWFPEGKEDPGLTLLRFDPTDAQVWVSKRGPLNYGFQIAKANATHTLPDVGQSAELKL